MQRPRPNATVFAAALVVALALQVLAAPVVLGLEPRPLPKCRYADVRTEFREPGQWRKTLLDTVYMVGRAYRPSSLVDTRRAGLNGGYRVRAALIDDLAALARAARRAGAAVAIRSAYRSYATQEAVFQQQVREIGYDAALRVSARPGHSEHQLGTTIDFRSANSTKAPWAYRDWGETKPGRWMIANAWQYGFVMSYPKGKKGESCYAYEPWHFRYVGREAAAAVRQAGVTLRRYLWEGYHADDPGAPS